MSLSVSTEVGEDLLWMRHPGGVYLLEGEGDCTWGKNSGSDARFEEISKENRK